MDNLDYETVRKMFNIPDKYRLLLSIDVGHFKKAMESAPPKWHKTVEEIIVKFH